VSMTITDSPEVGTPMPVKQAEDNKHGALHLR
jgi:hypothetical protein